MTRHTNIDSIVNSRRPLTANAGLTCTRRNSTERDDSILLENNRLKDEVNKLEKDLSRNREVSAKRAFHAEKRMEKLLAEKKMQRSLSVQSRINTGRPS